MFGGSRGTGGAGGAPERRFVKTLFKENPVFRHVLLASVIGLGAISATAASATSWITRDVHLRSGPGQHHPSRGVLGACSRVDVDGQHGGWLRVDSFDGYGWVSGRYVSGSRPRGCGQYRQQRHVEVDPYPYGHYQRPRVNIIIGHGGHRYRGHDRDWSHPIRRHQQQFGTGPYWQHDW